MLESSAKSAVNMPLDLLSDQWINKPGVARKPGAVRPDRTPWMLMKSLVGRTIDERLARTEVASRPKDISVPSPPMSGVTMQRWSSGRSLLVVPWVFLLALTSGSPAWALAGQGQTRPGSDSGVPERHGTRSGQDQRDKAALPNAADKLPEPATPKTSDPSGLKPPPEQPPGGDDKLKTSNAESPSPPVTKCAVSEPCIDPATAKLVKGSLWGLFTASAVTSIALLSINFTSAGTKVDVNGNEITRQLWYPGWTAAGISLAILAIAIPTTHIVNRRVLKDPAPSN